MAPIGEVIRAARERRGLSEEECAAKCGLNICSYSDVEQHRDEFFQNISLGTARRICRMLGIDPVPFIADHYGIDLPRVAGCSPEEFSGRHFLIQAAMTRKGMSEAELSDRSGITIARISGILRSADYIEAIPLDFISWIAAALDIDMGRLVCFERLSQRA